MTEFGIVSEVYSARVVRRVQEIRVVNEAFRLRVKIAIVDERLFTEFTDKLPSVQEQYKCHELSSTSYEQW